MVIVGEGMEIENLKKYADSLGIGDHLLFTGGKPWSEIGKYYQLGDVFCSASLSETQGLTFAEAMAGGIPVVARRDDCIVNFMTHGETGMFFDDPAELPDLLYRVLTDKPLREHLSTTSQNTMESLSVETLEIMWKNYTKKSYGHFKMRKASPCTLCLISREQGLCTAFPRYLKNWHTAVVLILLRLQKDCHFCPDIVPKK